MNKKKLLKEVSFNVQKNSILSIVGPNGAGKTTIFKGNKGIFIPKFFSNFKRSREHNIACRALY